jgi:outer membrane protein assembly factor BamB
MIMKRFLLLSLFTSCLAALLCSCTRPAESTGFDWPQWRGPDGNGQSRETEWDPASIATPRVLWKAEIGSGYANVVIQNGRLYGMGMVQGKVTVFCLDAATGRGIWHHALISSNYPQGAPTIDGDSLFALTTEGNLYCIDSRNGKERWKKDIVAEYGALAPNYGFAGSPIVEGDLVLLTANTAGMAVKRDTGGLAWTSEKPPEVFKSINRGESNGAGYSTPVIDSTGGSRRVLIAGWSGLSSVEVQTGRPVWQFGWEIEPAGLSSDPVVVGDRICVALAFEPSSHPSGFLMQAGDDRPEVLWRTPELWSFISTPVIADGYLYATYGGPETRYGTRVSTSLRCYDLETGRVMWDERFGASRPNTSFSLTTAKGTLIVLDDQGTLYTVETSSEGYKEIARCDVLQGAKKPRLFWTPPVLCNAKIYCRNFSGDLVCIDVSR